MQPRIGYHHKPSCSRPRAISDTASRPIKIKPVIYFRIVLQENNRQSEHQTRSNQPVLYQRQQQGSQQYLNTSGKAA